LVSESESLRGGVWPIRSPFPQFPDRSKEMGCQQWESTRSSHRESRTAYSVAFDLPFPGRVSQEMPIPNFMRSFQLKRYALRQTQASVNFSDSRLESQASIARKGIPVPRPGKFPVGIAVPCWGVANGDHQLGVVWRPQWPPHATRMMRALSRGPVMVGDVWIRGT
jgi:hypothetical protein